MARPAARLALPLGALLLLGACAVAPKPIPDAEHVERARTDYGTLYAGQPGIGGPLTAADAVARALKYNYDHQLALVEASLQDRQFDVAVMAMMPRLAASAGYTGRNNESASSSLSVITRRQSLEPSTSQDMDRGTGDLTFSWNLLDFGVGYFQARQQADRALIAVERRRRVVNTIVKEVRGAYWRAGTAQRLLPKIDPLLKEAEGALTANAEIERDSLAPVLPTLEYRKNLLQVISQLRRLRSDLSVAKAQLSALINVPPGTPFTVEEPPAQPDFPRALSADIATLELMGLSQRPELREEAYQERVDRNNLYKEIVRLMPGLSLLGSLNYDSNSYLVNNQWAEVGVRATFNLVNLLNAPKTIDAAETQVAVARTRRLALSVAVLTQVNVSHQTYLRSVETFDTALEVSRVESRIAKAVNDGGLADAEPEFERIRRGLSAVAAELDRDRAFTELQGALGNLYTSVGLDPVPVSVETGDLGALTATVRAALARLDKGWLPPLPAGSRPLGVPDDEPQAPPAVVSAPDARAEPEGPVS